MKLALIASVASALAGFVSYGKCATPSIEPKFDANAYLGKWYELANADSVRATFEKDLHCVTAEYSLKSADPLEIQVLNAGNKGSATGEKSSVIAKATQGKIPGELKVFFGGSPVGAPYNVIKLYGEKEQGFEVAVVYSCTQLLLWKTEAVWVLSRTPSLPAGVTMDDVTTLLQEQGVDAEKVGLQESREASCATSTEIEI